jgi:hypothetical protein
MKIGLIAVSGGRVRSPELAALGVALPGFVRRGKLIASVPSLGLLTVAGMTPPGHELRYTTAETLRRQRQFASKVRGLNNHSKKARARDPQARHRQGQPPASWRR